MNILSMLARLEGALGRNDLTKQMVLLPQSRSLTHLSTKEINFVVGYNGSPRSQTALDLTLWIAHQTRLVTHKQVTVQVVYVVNLSNECNRSSLERAIAADESLPGVAHSYSDEATIAQPALHPYTHSQITSPELAQAVMPQSCQIQQFDEADRILWQARNLAEEWRGSLKTHLRFGHVAEELRSVVQAESASLLLLGCEVAEDSLIQQLGSDFPCPVLGIPAALCVCS